MNFLPGPQWLLTFIALCFVLASQVTCTSYCPVPLVDPKSTLQDLVLGRKEGERLRETGHRSPFRMIPARAGMWVNGTHLTWRQLSILFGRQPADEVVGSVREGHGRLEAEGA